MTHIGRLIINIICEPGSAKSDQVLISSHPQRPKLGLKRSVKLLLGLLLMGMFGLTGEISQTCAGAVSRAELASGLVILSERRAAVDEPDADCLMCHADPDFKGSFENGDTLSLYVDPGEYAQSVHQPAGLNCVACHTDVSQYPHHTDEQITCISCHGEEGGQPDTPYTTLRVQMGGDPGHPGYSRLAHVPHSDKRNKS